MQIQNIEREAQTYLYDLMNEAREHGFKQDDIWTLSLVTETDRNRIQKDYYPALANKFSPEKLLRVFQSIKSELHQELNNEEMQMNEKSVLNDDLKYIAAFNPKRLR